MFSCRASSVVPPPGLADRAAPATGFHLTAAFAMQDTIACTAVGEHGDLFTLIHRFKHVFHTQGLANHLYR